MEQNSKLLCSLNFNSVGRAARACLLALLAFGLVLQDRLAITIDCIPLKCNLCHKGEDCCCRVRCCQETVCMAIWMVSIATLILVSIEWN